MPWAISSGCWPLSRANAASSASSMDIPPRWPGSAASMATARRPWASSISGRLGVSPISSVITASTPIPSCMRPRPWRPDGRCAIFARCPDPAGGPLCSGGRLAHVLDEGGDAQIGRGVAAGEDADGRVNDDLVLLDRPHAAIGFPGPGIVIGEKADELAGQNQKRGGFDMVDRGAVHRTGKELLVEPLQISA